MPIPITISRKEIIITVTSHYLETGVIENPDIDTTIATLQSYSDVDLMATLIESHALREECYAVECYRCPN